MSTAFSARKNPPRAYVLTWDVDCPTCHAPAGKRCRNSLGERSKFHVARTRAAAAATKAARG